MRTTMHESLRMALISRTPAQWKTITDSRKTLSEPAKPVHVRSASSMLNKLWRFFYRAVNFGRRDA